MRSLWLTCFWFLWFCACSLAEVTIGILPLKLEAPSEYTYLKEALENQLYHRLWVPSQVKTVLLNKEEGFSGLDYLLSLGLKVEKDYVEIKLKLTNLKLEPEEVLVKEEKVPRDGLFPKIALYCEEIRRAILEPKPQTPAINPISGGYPSGVNPSAVSIPSTEKKTTKPQVIEEKKSFLSRINPFEKVSDWFSNLFAKESEFKITVPIPSPPPPPGVVLSQQPSIHQPQVSLPPPKTKTSSHQTPPAFDTTLPTQPQPSFWQWF